VDLVTLLTIVGAVAAVVAIWQSYRANRLSAQIAQAQGALATTDIKLSLLGDHETDFFGIALPFAPERIFELPLALSVENAGQKTAREIELYLRVPKRLLYGGSGVAQFQFDGPAEKMKAAVVARTDQLETILISIPSLHPQQSVGLDLKLSLSGQTLGEDSAKMSVKDGTLTVRYRFAYSHVIEAIVAQTDRPTLSRSYHFVVIDTAKNTISEYFKDQRKKPRRVLGKGRPGVKVFEFEVTSIERNTCTQIDRPKSGASCKVYEGVVLPDGRYFIPSANVDPRGTA
jgi:hypothetical protein